jgi:plasmid maintenance system killer protein
MNKKGTPPLRYDFNKFFLQWLIGFIDAEGNFQITTIVNKTKNNIHIKYSFHLSLSIKDKDLLYEIKNFFNMGQIYLYTHRKEAHYALTRLKDLKTIVSLFDNYGFFTRHQSDRYYLFRLVLFNKKRQFENIEHLNSYLQKPVNCPQYTTKDLNFSYTEKVYNTYDLNMIYSNWICGFITGEGCFSQSKKRKVFYFHLEQAEREVLDFMSDSNPKAYFSFNPKIRENKLRPKRKQTYSLAINSKADLLKLITFLNNNDTNFIGLKGNKKKQYEQILI